MSNSWKDKSLGQLIALEYGASLRDDTRTGEGKPVYGSNGVVGYHTKSLVDGPGIVVGRKGSVGKVIWSDSDFWPIDTAYFVNTKGNSNLKWMYYLLGSLRLSRLDSSTGVPGLNRNDVYRLAVQEPPDPEQSKIAEILSTCDDAIEHTEAIIAKHKRIKQGLMQDLLTKGIDENGNIRSEKTHKFKDSPLGRIPVEWDNPLIGKVCNLINGRAFKPSEWSEYGLPIIRIENLNNPDASFNYCSFAVIQRFFVKSGDLLISWSGTPETSFGIFDWQRGEAILNQHIFRVQITDPKVSKGFFLWAYKSILNRMIGSSHGGVGLRHITKTELNNLRLPRPSESEQEQIVETLQAAEDSINCEESFRIKLIAVKRGLMQDLLSGKVRVTPLMQKV